MKLRFSIKIVGRDLSTLEQEEGRSRPMVTAATSQSHGMAAGQPVPPDYRICRRTGVMTHQRRQGIPGRNAEA